VIGAFGDWMVPGFFYRSFRYVLRPARIHLPLTRRAFPASLAWERPGAPGFAPNPWPTGPSPMIGVWGRRSDLALPHLRHLLPGHEAPEAGAPRSSFRSDEPPGRPRARDHSAHRGVSRGAARDRIGTWRSTGPGTPTPSLRRPAYFKKHLEPGFDLVVEDINKIPFFMPRHTRVPVLAVVPHLFGTTVFEQAAFPIAAYVYLYERFIPKVYRNCRFSVLSETTGTI